MEEEEEKTKTKKKKKKKKLSFKKIPYLRPSRGSFFQRRCTERGSLKKSDFLH